MDEILSILYNYLTADEQLMDMLALNLPFFNPKGAEAKENSIIPVPHAKNTTKTPFITVQQGVLTMGKVQQQEALYIRAYNDKLKTYIEINKICEMLRVLLHDIELPMTQHTNIRVRFDSALAVSQDEALDFNYRELHFTVFML